MDLDEYQRGALTTAVYPDYWGLVYPATKLAGEAGEIQEKIGKMMRNGDLYITDAGRISIPSGTVVDDLVKELGDVLWYVAVLAHELGVSLNTVALENQKKLHSRSVRGLIIGEGDNR